MKRYLYFILLVIFAFGCASRPMVPHFTSHVFDPSNTLSSVEHAALESELARYEDSTSTQIVIELIPSTKGEPAADLATRTANENHLGQHGKDNGILILLAVQDRTGFMSIGYGIERIISDVVANQIWRDNLTPHLKKGDYYGGLEETIDILRSKLVGQFKTDTFNKKS
jgi:uncharacterized protein